VFEVMAEKRGSWRKTATRSKAQDLTHSFSRCDVIFAGNIDDAQSK